MMKMQQDTERGAPLGLFSHLVVGTILELKEQDEPTHGLRITEQLIAKTNSLIDPGQTYLTLKRLTGRKLVQPTNGASHGVKTYVVTPAGMQAFAATDKYIQIAAKLQRKGKYERKTRSGP
jgi:DNA-binding PadR family transcriptional regulator